MKTKILALALALQAHAQSFPEAVYRFKPFQTVCLKRV